MSQHAIQSQGYSRQNFIQCWTRVSIDGVNGLLTEYSSGPIRSVAATFETRTLGRQDPQDAQFIVTYSDGVVYEWTEKQFGVYEVQFGTSVSPDGEFVFVQTWERGMFAYAARTGELVWKTKSRRGITNVYVNEKTVLCHQHEHALQLLDIRTGEVIKEKRPATAWGFYYIDEGVILCQTRANKWEIISTEDLETLASAMGGTYPNELVDNFRSRTI